MAWDDAPPTAAELAALKVPSQASSGPDWASAPPSEQEMAALGLTRAPAPSAMASGARQFLSGFAGNFDDELSGAISAAGRVAGVKNLGTWKPFNPDSHLQYDEPTLDKDKLLESYKENRDIARQEQERDIAAHPGVSAVANVAGMITNPVIRNLSPAGMGAVQGLGDSQADLTKGDVLGAAEDTGKAAITNYLMGKAADKVVGVATPALQDFAQSNAVRALGMNKSDIARMGVDEAKNLGQTAIDEGVISSNPFKNSTESMLERAQALKDQGGQAMGDVYQQIDQAGASTFNPLDVATDVENQLAPTYKTPINKGEWGQLENTMESILQRGDGTIPLTEAQALKEEIGQVAYPKGKRPLDPTPKQQMAADAYGIVNKAINDAADSGAEKIGSDDLRSALQAAKDKYGAGKSMVDSLESEQAGELSQNGMFNKGLSRYLNPLNTAKAAFEDTVGNPRLLAGQANNLAQVLQRTPQVFGKYTPVLMRAAARGENSLNASDYVLQQRDPEYRALKEKLNNGGNNQ